MGECASVLGQKKCATHRRVGVLQIVFSLSGKYTQDLWFLHKTIYLFIYLSLLLFLSEKGFFSVVFTEIDYLDL